MNAYILVHTQAGTAVRVRSEIRALRHVVSVSLVQGPYDLIVRVDGDSVHEITEGVVASIQHVPGVIRALTCPVVGPARVRLADAPTEHVFVREKRPMAAAY